MVWLQVLSDQGKVDELVLEHVLLARMFALGRLDVVALVVMRCLCLVSNLPEMAKWSQRARPLLVPLRAALSWLFSIDFDVIQHRTAIVEQLKLRFGVILPFELFLVVVDR